LVRFQNTGNDTAFKVVVKDTLDKDLDLSTLSIEGSSHRYVYTLSGKNQAVLTFSFYNINLPDSTTDRVGSNGYIQYSIAAKANLAKGTNISNRAAIYFDFNSAILTNTTTNTMQDTVMTDRSLIRNMLKTANGYTLVSTVTEQAESKQVKTKFELHPNPSNGTVYLFTGKGTSKYCITDLSGKPMQEGQTDESGDVALHLEHLPEGMYLVGVGNAWKRLILRR
jgi:hypothetical protein